MRNRALIARWTFDHCDGAMQLVSREGKTFLQITDYPRLRQAFGSLLAEIQRIKSEGDFEEARRLVETYAVQVDAVLHKEILERYARLDLAPYKGFLNPRLTPVVSPDGTVSDIQVDYSESYEQQMMRYSQDYAALIS